VNSWFSENNSKEDQIKNINFINYQQISIYRYVNILLINFVVLSELVKMVATSLSMTDNLEIVWILSFTGQNKGDGVYPDTCWIIPNINRDGK
jgi:hypothetical protein